MKLRQIIGLLAAFITLFTATVSYGGGLFPTYDNLFVELPSFQKIAQRKPDKEQTLSDHSRLVMFNNVSKSEFDSFSSYIASYGCSLEEYSNAGNTFRAKIKYKDVVFTFEYNSATRTVSIVYPPDSQEELVVIATPTPKPTKTPTPRPTKTPTPKPTKTPTPRPTKTKTPTPKPNKVSVIIPNEAQCKWHTVSTKRFTISFSVKNTNPYKKVKYYEVTYYTGDTYDNQNGPTTTVRIEQEINSYETVMSSLIYMDNPNDVFYVHLSITRVMYTDGTSESASPSYTWWHFT